MMKEIHKAMFAERIKNIPSFVFFLVSMGLSSIGIRDEARIPNHYYKSTMSNSQMLMGLITNGTCVIRNETFQTDTTAVHSRNCVTYSTIWGI